MIFSQLSYTVVLKLWCVRHWWYKGPLYGYLRESDVLFCSLKNKSMPVLCVDTNKHILQYTALYPWYSWEPLGWVKQQTHKAVRVQGSSAASGTLDVTTLTGVPTKTSAVALGGAHRLCHWKKADEKQTLSQHPISWAVASLSGVVV